MDQEIADQVVRKISNLIITQDDLSAFTSGTEQEGVEKIINYLGAAVTEDRRQLQTQPDHEGLDDTCNNKLCDYLKYQLSCKSIGFDMEKICARYLLGSVLGCKQFPHEHNEVYQAPSVCLQEYLSKFIYI
ncbi:hypothetical protein EON65_04910 [archaeon]|nr:MAG: hypothetical protein EON65_04910 [archaeon]